MSDKDLALDLRDNYAEGFNNTLQQFRESPIYLGVMKSYLDEVNELEQCANELLTEKTILDAAGIQLDWLAYLYNYDRPSGMTDDELRVQIYALGFAVAAAGTPDSVKTALAGMARGDFIRIFEHLDAGFTISMSSRVARSLINPALQYMKPAGCTAVYLEMGSHMRWRGVDIVPLREVWSTEDGTDNIVEKIPPSTTNQIIFNTAKSGQATDVRYAQFNEIPRFLATQVNFVTDNTQWMESGSGTVSINFHQDIPEAVQQEIDNNSTNILGYDENTQSDLRGIFCEVYK